MPAFGILALDSKKISENLLQTPFDSRSVKDASCCALLKTPVNQRLEVLEKHPAKGHPQTYLNSLSFTSFF